MLCFSYRPHEEVISANSWLKWTEWCLQLHDRRSVGFNTRSSLIHTSDNQDRCISDTVCYKSRWTKSRGNILSYTGWLSSVRVQAETMMAKMRPVVLFLNHLWGRARRKYLVSSASKLWSAGRGGCSLCLLRLHTDVCFYYSIQMLEPAFKFSLLFITNWECKYSETTIQIQTCAESHQGLIFWCRESDVGLCMPRHSGLINLWPSGHW